MVINPGGPPWWFLVMVSGDFRAHGGLHCRKLVFLIFIFALEHELAWFEYAQRIQALPNHARRRA